MQYKIDALERTIEYLRKSREKTLEMMKKGVEDLVKTLKSLDDQISSKELEILSLRQRVESLLSSEKISKDFLLKPLPPPSFISPLTPTQTPFAPSSQSPPSYLPPSPSSSSHPPSSYPPSSPLPPTSSSPLTSSPLPPPTSSPPPSPPPNSNLLQSSPSSLPLLEGEGILPHSSVEKDVVLIDKEKADAKLYNFAKKKEEKTKVDSSSQIDELPPQLASQPPKVFNFSKKNEEGKGREEVDESRMREDDERRSKEDDSQKKKKEEERIRKEEEELKKNEEEARSKKEEEDKRKEEEDRRKKEEEGRKKDQERGRRVSGNEPAVTRMPPKKKFNANLWDDSEVTNPFDIPEIAAKPIDFDINEGNFNKKEKGANTGIDKENEPKGEVSLRRGENSVKETQNSVKESMNSVKEGRYPVKESQNSVKEGLNSVKEAQNSVNPPVMKKKIADPFEVRVEDGEDWVELNGGGGVQMKGKMKIEEKVNKQKKIIFLIFNSFSFFNMVIHIAVCFI